MSGLVIGPCGTPRKVTQGSYNSSLNCKNRVPDFWRFQTKYFSHIISKFYLLKYMTRRTSIFTVSNALDESTNTTISCYFDWIALYFANGSVIVAPWIEQFFFFNILIGSY